MTIETIRNHQKSAEATANAMPLTHLERMPFFTLAAIYEVALQLAIANASNGVGDDADQEDAE